MLGDRDWRSAPFLPGGNTRNTSEHAGVIINKWIINADRLWRLCGAAWLQCVPTAFRHDSTRYRFLRTKHTVQCLKAKARGLKAKTRGLKAKALGHKPSTDKAMAKAYVPKNEEDPWTTFMTITPKTK